MLAVLHCAVLCCVVLYCAVLCCIVLCCVAVLNNKCLAILKTVWRVSIYVHIIKGCVVTGDCDLALHMLSEMQRMKHCVRMCNYEALIQIVNKPDHLNHFLPVRLFVLQDV